MSKELLENLLIEFDEMGYEPTTLCDIKREVESFRRRLKQALDYLKSIDNANPSEALECLEWVIKNYIGNDYYVYEEELDTIKQYILKAQEQEKVLSIIKEKNVDIWLLKSCLTVELYNFSITKMDNCNVFNLTKEEFDLLKRWLYD